MEDRDDRFDRAIERMGVRIKDMDQLKVRSEVFDEVTLLALYKLVHKKWLSAIGGSISTGKEAIVFLGDREDREIAIKIYRIRTANFNAMSEYIIGDRRFSGIRKTRKEIVFAWTKKEFANLKRAFEAGVPVPEPIVSDRNILLMQFLGKGGKAYPQIRNVEMKDPEAMYTTILSYIELLYSGAGLVHADLSEYNVLCGDRLYLIDMGQSVLRDHPRAFQFLRRDIANINRFFSPRCPVIGEEEVFWRVTGIRVGDSQQPAGSGGEGV